MGLQVGDLIDQQKYGMIVNAGFFCKSEDQHMRQRNFGVQRDFEFSPTKAYYHYEGFVHHDPLRGDVIERGSQLVHDDFGQTQYFID